MSAMADKDKDKVEGMDRRSFLRGGLNGAVALGLGGVDIIYGGKVYTGHEDPSSLDIKDFHGTILNEEKTDG